MNDGHDPHGVTPDFRASLEREIAREFRRERLFAPDDRAHRRHRFAMAVGLTMGGVVTLTIGLVLGVSTGYASAEVLHARANHDTTTPSQPALAILRTIPVRDAINAVTCAAAQLSGKSKPAQAAIPTLDVETVARSKEPFGSVVGLHHGNDGQVLVNDAERRQLKLLDSSLASTTIVLDSVPGTANSYGPIRAPLIPYRGDSSLFKDWNAQTLVVLDPHGHVARALALPSVREFRSVGGPSTGVDGKGRIVFAGGRTPTGKELTDIGYGDSIAIARTDLDLRRTDTIARFARPLMKVTTEKYSDGSQSRIFAVDPLQSVDEWAVLSTGAVAIVRGHDYHIDWIQPDGSTTSTPKIPFEWRRVTDDDKQRLVDSLRGAQNALLNLGYPGAESRTRAPVPCDRGRGGGGDPGAGARGGGRSGGGGGGPPPDSPGMCVEMLAGTISYLNGFAPPPMPSLVDLSREGPIADYEPALFPGGTAADRDGNLWILPKRTQLSLHGGLVYDVVNLRGELFERVRLPQGRAIAGFGKGGVVYLTSGDRTSGYYLERGRLPSKK